MLAAGSRAGQPAPLPVLLALDAETVPVAAVERARELLGEAGAAGFGIGTRALRGDLLLQYQAHGAAVGGGQRVPRWMPA